MIFGEFLVVSVSWETKHEKFLEKFGENSEENSEKIRDENPKKFSFLALSPNTVGSPDLFQEGFRKEAHRFSQSLFQPYSEMI